MGATQKRQGEAAEDVLGVNEGVALSFIKIFQRQV
jgi:hypothetical protein